MPPLAEPFSVDWHTIDGGTGVTSTGGTYSVSATIGQHDAGHAAAPPYLLHSGFWAPNLPCNAPPQDVNGDTSADVADFIVFQTCFNGPDRPPACE